MDRNDMLENASRNALAAVEMGQAALADAADRIAPYVDQASVVIGPIAANAAEKIRPVLRDAEIRGARVARVGLSKVQPVIDEALRQAGPAADAAVKRVAPAVDDILHRIPPGVGAASDKLHDELLPRLSDTLATLAERPLADEALPAIVAAAVLAKPAKKRPWLKRLGILALVIGVGAVAYAALKNALRPPDAGWVTHTPTDAYIADPTDDDESQGEPIVVGVPPDELNDETDADEMIAAESAEPGDEPPFADSPYGPGSYVGDEPPQGYDIKGNARSMKYHKPGQVMYARTTAEVWFDSPVAAEKAGFAAVAR